jgi:hypothetical protein
VSFPRRGCRSSLPDATGVVVSRRGRPRVVYLRAALARGPRRPRGRDTSVLTRRRYVVLGSGPSKRACTTPLFFISFFLSVARDLRAPRGLARYGPRSSRGACFISHTRASCARLDALHIIASRFFLFLFFSSSYFPLSPSTSTSFLPFFFPHFPTHPLFASSYPRGQKRPILNDDSIQRQLVLHRAAAESFLPPSSSGECHLVYLPVFLSQKYASLG